QGLTPLRKAVALNKAEIARILVAYGAEPSVRDPAGRTVLHIAVMQGRRELIAPLLVSKDSCVNVQDSHGWSPLHFAVRGKHIHAINWLLYAGADISLKNKEDKTAMDLCDEDSPIRAMLAKYERALDDGPLDLCSSFIGRKQLNQIGPDGLLMFVTSSIWSERMQFIFCIRIRPYRAMPPIPLRLDEQYYSDVWHYRMMRRLSPKETRVKAYFRLFEELIDTEIVLKITSKRKFLGEIPFTLSKYTQFNYTSFLAGAEMDLKDEGQFVMVKRPISYMLLKDQDGIYSNRHCGMFKFNLPDGVLPNPPPEWNNTRYDREWEEAEAMMKKLLPETESETNEATVTEKQVVWGDRNMNADAAPDAEATPEGGKGAEDGKDGAGGEEKEPGENEEEEEEEEDWPGGIRPGTILEGDEPDECADFYFISKGWALYLQLLHPLPLHMLIDKSIFERNAIRCITDFYKVIHTSNKQPTEKCMMQIPKTPEFVRVGTILVFARRELFPDEVEFPDPDDTPEEYFLSSDGKNTWGAYWILKEKERWSVIPSGLVNKQSRLIFETKTLTTFIAMQLTHGSQKWESELPGDSSSEEEEEEEAVEVKEGEGEEEPKEEVVEEEGEESAEKKKKKKKKKPMSEIKVQESADDSSNDEIEGSVTEFTFNPVDGSNGSRRETAGGSMIMEAPPESSSPQLQGSPSGSPQMTPQMKPSKQATDHDKKDISPNKTRSSLRRKSSKVADGQQSSRGSSVRIKDDAKSENDASNNRTDMNNSQAPDGVSLNTSLQNAKRPSTAYSVVSFDDEEEILAPEQRTVVSWGLKIGMHLSAVDLRTSHTLHGVNQFVHSLPSVRTHYTISSYTVYHQFIHSLPSVRTQFTISSYTLYHQFVHSLPSVRTHYTISSYTVYHQFVHSLPSVRTHYTISSYTVYHQFVHIIPSVRTQFTISSYTVCHQFVHSLPSVRTQFTISSYTVYHQFVHIIPSVRTHYTISLYTVYHQFVHSLPSVRTQLTISSYTVYHQFVHSLPSVRTHYTISSYTVYHQFVHIIPSVRTQFTISSYTLYHQFVHSLPSVRTKFTISSYTVYHQFVHSLPSVRTEFTISSYTVYHQFVHTIPSVRTQFTISSYTVYHQFVHIIPSVRTQFTISSYTAYHQFVHSLPSVRTQFTISSYTLYHQFVHSLPSVRTQFTISSYTLHHQFVHSLPSVHTHYTISSYTVYHQFVHSLPSVRTHYTISSYTVYHQFVHIIPSVRTQFTISSYTVYHQFVHSLPSVRTQFAISSYTVYHQFVHSLPSVRTQFTISSYTLYHQFVHSLPSVRTQFTISSYTVYHQFVHSLPSVRTQFTISSYTLYHQFVHSLPSVRTQFTISSYTLYHQFVHSLPSVRTHYTISSYTVYHQFVHIIPSVRTQFTISSYTVYHQFVHSLPSVRTQFTISSYTVYHQFVHSLPSVRTHYTISSYTVYHQFVHSLPSVRTHYTISSYTVYHQFVHSLPSVRTQLTISSYTVYHQFVHTIPSVRTQFTISSYTVYHQFVHITPSVRTQFTISSYTLYHQFVHSLPSVRTQFTISSYTVYHQFVHIIPSVRTQFTISSYTVYHQFVHSLPSVRTHYTISSYTLYHQFVHSLPSVRTQFTISSYTVYHQFVHSLPSVRTQFTISSYTVYHQFVHIIPSVRTQFTISSYTLYHQFVHSLPSVRTHYTISSYTVYHQFVHSLPSVRTQFTISSYTVYHQFVHIIPSVRTHYTISSYTVYHQFVHSLPSVRTQLTISSYTAYHQFVHSLPSVRTQLTISSYTAYHQFVYSLPSVRTQLTISSYTAYHQFVHSLPSVCTQLTISSYTAYHQFVHSLPSVRTQLTMIALLIAGSNHVKVFVTELKSDTKPREVFLLGLPPLESSYYSLSGMKELRRPHPKPRPVVEAQKTDLEEIPEAAMEEPAAEKPEEAGEGEETVEVEEVESDEGIVLKRERMYSIVQIKDDGSIMLEDFKFGPPLTELSISDADMSLLLTEVAYLWRYRNHCECVASIFSRFRDGVYDLAIELVKASELYVRAENWWGEGYRMIAQTPTFPAKSGRLFNFLLDGPMVVESPVTHVTGSVSQRSMFYYLSTVSCLEYVVKKATKDEDVKPGGAKKGPRKKDDKADQEPDCRLDIMQYSPGSRTNGLDIASLNIFLNAADLWHQRHVELRSSDNVLLNSLIKILKKEKAFKHKWWRIVLLLGYPEKEIETEKGKTKWSVIIANLLTKWFEDNLNAPDRGILKLISVLSIMELHNTIESLLSGLRDYKGTLLTSKKEPRYLKLLFHWVLNTKITRNNIMRLIDPQILKPVSDIFLLRMSLLLDPGQIYKIGAAMDVEDNVIHAVQDEESIKDSVYFPFRVLIKSRQKKDEIIHYTLLLLEMTKQCNFQEAQQFLITETKKWMITVAETEPDICAKLDNVFS
ncbi:ankyrin repeat-containing protein C6C3.08, partial [Biomphalaria glabrata]